MWEHAASALTGNNLNQTFNIYTGAGSNGKSMFVKLMEKALGDLKGTVPISLITQKRQGIGASSSEVACLKGLRYACMNEPSKGDKINEGGILKEITGGDPIQARQLYSESIIFTPQFKLVCCTNHCLRLKHKMMAHGDAFDKFHLNPKFVSNPSIIPMIFSLKRIKRWRVSLLSGHQYLWGCWWKSQEKTKDM